MFCMRFDSEFTDRSFSSWFVHLGQDDNPCKERSGSPQGQAVLLAEKDDITKEEERK